MDRKRSSLLFAAAAYAAIGSACSFGALNGFSGAPEADAGPPTADSEPPREDGASSPVDAGSEGSSDAATDADGGSGAPNLVQNPGFENGSSCGPPWTSYQSTLALDTESRSGAQSCKVCRWSGASDDFTISHSGTIDSTAAIGAKYRVSAYVRLKSGALGGTHLVLRTWGPSSTTEQSPSPVVTLDNTWKLVEVTGSIGISPGSVDLFIASSGKATTDCFIIDDVRAERLQ